MEIQGTLKALQPVIEREKFTSRKVWLTTAENPEYPQTIEIEVNQAKVDMFDGVAIGAPVTCSVNLRGREWTDPQGVVKVFNTLVCWKVTAGGFVPQPAASSVTDGQEAPDTQGLPF